MWRSTASTLGRTTRHYATHRSTTPDLLADLAALVARYPLVDPASVDRIHHALTDLERRDRPANVAIVGDRASGAQRLTTALVDDPLSNPPDVTVALESRRLDPNAPEAIRIQYDREARSTASEVRVPAKWLDDNSAAVTEIVHSGDVPPLESSFTTLHLADLVVVVVSSTSLLASRSARTLVLDLHEKPHVVICLDCPPNQAGDETLETLRYQLDKLLPTPPTYPAQGTSGTTTSRPQVVAVSTRQALAALSALVPSEPSTAPSFEAFQSDYLASNVPTVKDLVSSILTLHAPSSISTTTTTEARTQASEPTRLQLATARHVLSSALSRAAFTGAVIQDSLAAARATLSALEQQTDELSRQVAAHLAVDPETGLVPVPRRDLDRSVSALRTALDDRFQLYKVPFKADDLESELSLVANDAFLREWERDLVYSTAEFENLKRIVAETLDKTLASPPFSELSHSPPGASHEASARPPRSPTPPTTPTSLTSLYSPTVLNEVAQARHASPTSPSYLPPYALSSPVSHRRAQLSARGGPIQSLHRRTQQAVARAATVSVSSVASAVGAYGLEWIEWANAGAAAALGATFAVWTLQRGWEKAKKRFFQDVERVVGGVEEDLGVAFSNLLERAEYPTRLAVSLYRSKIQEREQEFTVVRDELRRIANASRDDGEVEGTATRRTHHDDEGSADGR
ncbi:hypothetical protein JCM10212_002876 [Sporobolomyces blumeae]